MAQTNLHPPSIIPGRMKGRIHRRRFLYKLKVEEFSVKGKTKANVLEESLSSPICNVAFTVGGIAMIVSTRGRSLSTNLLQELKQCLFVSSVLFQTLFTKK